jgi:hypothetical protein
VKKIENYATEAKAGEIELFFADPTHPTHNMEAGACWQVQGQANTLCLPSNSGRKRLNIIGALNAISLQPTLILSESIAKFR